MHPAKTSAHAARMPAHLPKALLVIVATCMVTMLLAFPMRALATGDRATGLVDGMMDCAMIVGGGICLVVMAVCALGALWLAATGR
jgi:hypothetical protein